MDGPGVQPRAEVATGGDHVTTGAHGARRADLAPTSAGDNPDLPGGPALAFSCAEAETASTCRRSTGVLYCLSRGLGRLDPIAPNPSALM